MLVELNKTISAIVKEASKLDPLEQEILLTKLRVKRLKKTSFSKIATSSKAIKKPSLKQIDKWKHAARVK